jgi:hypothetical protein
MFGEVVNCSSIRSWQARTEARAGVNPQVELFANAANTDECGLAQDLG